MGATHFSGPVYSDGGFVGPISGGTIAATNITASGTLAVTGTSTLTGNTTVGGTLGVTGAVTLTAGITVGTTLAVTGASTFTGGVTTNGALTVNGDFNAQGADSVKLPAPTAAGTPANFSADGYLAVSDGSTTRYLAFADATW